VASLAQPYFVMAELVEIFRHDFRSSSFLKNKCMLLLWGERISIAFRDAPLGDLDLDLSSIRFAVENAEVMEVGPNSFKFKGWCLPVGEWQRVLCDIVVRFS
jgi:hypothetical protein